MEEGVKGKRAGEWQLVDEVVPNKSFDETVQQRANEFAQQSAKADVTAGIVFNEIERAIGNDSVTYSSVKVELDRKTRCATITLLGPQEDAPHDIEAFQAQGDQAYLLKLCRELEDAILHLRFNEIEIGLWIFKTQGDAEKLRAHEALLAEHAEHWLANEVHHFWKRTLKRIDVTSRSLTALVEHGSCFAGVLLNFCSR